MKTMALGMTLLLSTTLVGCSNERENVGELNTEVEYVAEKTAYEVVPVEVEENDLSNDLPFTVFETSLKEAILQMDAEIADLFLDMYTFDVPFGAISIDEAAEIGARYIKEMLGFDIQSQYVAVAFYDRVSDSGQYWRGRVGDSAEDIATFRHRFEFMVDVLTGEWTSIQHVWDESVTAGVTDFYTTLTPEQIAHFTTLAEDFAKRHFQVEAIEGITYFGAESRWIAPIEDLDNIIQEFVALFTVTYNSQEASVGIAVENEQLRFFTLDMLND
ncbi:MAG: hypothetical protein FWF59_14410 [Turicibacter sp.]|nr:hypothetical protein [Turicibacter sp.]